MFTPAPGGGTSSGAITFTVNNPAPSLSSISPTGAIAGTSADYTLTATGSSFVPTSVVKWAGTALSTTYVSSTSLTAIIPAANMASTGTFSVTVFSPAPGGGTTAGKNFSVSSNSVTLTTLYPTSANVGDPDINSGHSAGGAYVWGTNFSSNSVVQWNGTTLPGCHYVGSTDIDSFSIPAAYLTTPGTFSVTVFTPAGNGEPGGTSSPAKTFTVNNTTPTLSSISPTGATAGTSDDYTLTVTGANFSPSAVVKWAGAALSTTYLDSGDLTAIIPAGNMASSGNYSITVTNPGSGGGTSSGITFAVASAPNLTTRYPTSATAGDGDINSGHSSVGAYVWGTNFSSNSVVQWNGTTLPGCHYVGSTDIDSFSIPASDLTTAGTFYITVFTPAATGQTGGASSNSMTFTVNNPTPSLSSINPTSAAQGAGDTTLTLSGGSFVPTSVVQWAGAALSTTYVSSSTLTAVIPAANLATAGTATVTVFNPAPGGGTSGGKTFTINNPAPTLSSMNPTSANAGSSDTTLTLSGGNFNASSVAKWDGASLSTTYYPSSLGTLLTAVIPAANLTPGGTHTVTVTNPTPGGGTSAGLTFTVNNLTPTLSTIGPTSSTAGGPGFTLTVNGANFVTTSVVNWNGSARSTTYVSTTQLTASISAADVATAGTFPVTVTNPAPAGGTSGSVNFTVNGAPTVTSISPTSANAGSSNTTLTVTGTNFVSTSVVQWNGTSLSTTYGGSTTLTATIPTAYLTTGGTFTVTVFTPSPAGGSGGVTTSAPSFTVNNLTPTVTTINPTNTAAGGNAFTLTVNGTNFVSTSVVNWNGSARSTTYVSTTQVTAAITAADILTAGTFPVTVTNPAPGGGTSNSVNFTVNAAAPTITSISPTSGNAGRSAFTLTVNGANYVSGSSTVNWNGSARTTTYVSQTQLTAAITAADVATAGTFPVTVTTPGGTSGPTNFTVNSHAWATTSGPSSDTYGLVYDSVHNMTYAATDGGAVWRYNGSAWTQMGTTVSGTVYCIAYDSHGDTVYAGNSAGKIYRCPSASTSATWADMSSPYGSSMHVDSLAYDSVNNVLYAGSQGSGVYRCPSPSTASSWTTMGLGTYYNYSLVYDSAHNALYAGTNGDGSGCWRCNTPNTASSWTNMGGPGSVYYVYSLDYDSTNNILYAGTLYYGVWKCTSASTATASGNWAKISGSTFSGSEYIYALCYDSVHNVLYAGPSSTHGVWSCASPNSSTSWSNTGTGIPANTVCAIECDTVNEWVYAGMTGAGAVWKY